MVKLTLQWEGPPDHHEGYPAKLHQTCNSVEGETQRPVVQSKQSLPLGLQSTPQGLKKRSKKASLHRLY